MDLSMVEVLTVTLSCHTWKLFTIELPPDVKAGAPSCSAGVECICQLMHVMMPAVVWPSGRAPSARDLAVGAVAADDLLSGNVWPFPYFYNTIYIYIYSR